ncbi:MAG: hypothetical protein Q9159_002845 [Coniocarpon cinnabarinum]
MLSSKSHKYTPVQDEEDFRDDKDAPTSPEDLNREDPLSYANGQWASDSEDDEYRNDKSKTKLLSGRSRSRRKSVSSLGSDDSTHGGSGAYTHRRISSRIRSIGSLPTQHLSPRRIGVAVVVVLVLVVLLGSWKGSSYLPHVTPTYQSNVRIDGESPAWYPSPRGGTMPRWEAAYEKAWDMVRNMTLAEKVNITTGTGWMMGLCVGNTGPAMDVGFPSLCLQDGPLGLRFADNITASPAGITVGATWSPALMYKRGRMMGYEARRKGVNVILGPSVGAFGRVPAGGRNWESFGVDPIVQSYGAALTIRGIQEEGVMATVKHFVANEQEHYRQAFEWGTSEGMSSNLDERTLHELYGWPFADAVRAGVSSVMCSYNQVNNSYACQNSKLLNGFIKDELGFQGFIQSDWLAQRSGVASALAGLDMSMPGDGVHWADGIPFWGPYLTEAVLNETLPLERLNDMVTRIVAAWYQIGQDGWPKPPPLGDGGPNFSSWTDEETGVVAPGSDDDATRVVNQHLDAASGSGFSHPGLARRIAAEGTVLLKNAGDVLPLSRNGWSQSDEEEYEIDMDGHKIRVAIFGEDAVVPEGGPNQCADRGCNKGTLAVGWGSGATEFSYLVSPWEALKRDFKKSAVDLVLSGEPSNVKGKGQEPVKAEEQDLCIVFVNSAGGEGFIASDGIKGDRNDLHLSKNGDKLIRDIADRCGRAASSPFARMQPVDDRVDGPNAKRGSGNGLGGRGNVIVVIHAIGPVLLEKFIEHPNVAGVLMANLPGQESGHALADVLFGRVNPSGHLPYTIAKKFDDYGPAKDLIYSSSDPIPQQNFSEGLLVDYRWFDANKLTPRYEFGYGLSFSAFSMGNLQITQKYTEHPEPFPEGRLPDEVEPPPYSDKIPPPSEAFFPSGFRKLKKFIYPYIEPDTVITPDLDPEWKHFPLETPSPAGGGEGGNPALYEELVQVEVDVTNLGERSGHAVPQLYIVFPEEVMDGEAPVEFPPRVLRGFDKIRLRGSVSAPSPGSALPDQAIRQHNLASAGQAKPMTPREKLDAMIVAAKKQKKIKDQALAGGVENDERPDEAVPVESLVPRGDPTVHTHVHASNTSSSTLDTDASGHNDGNQEYLHQHDKRIDPAGLADDPETKAKSEGQNAEAAVASAKAVAEEAATPVPDLPEPPPPPEEGEPPPEPVDGDIVSYDSHAPLPGPTMAPNFSNPDHVGHPRVYDIKEVKEDEWADGGRIHNRVGQPPIHYATGERQTVTFYLTRRDLSYWSVQSGNWVIPHGTFGIEVGWSSRDIVVRGRLW